MRTGLTLTLVAALLMFGLAAAAAGAETPEGEAPAASDAPGEPGTPPDATTPAETAPATKGAISPGDVLKWGGIIGWIILVLFIVGIGWLLLCLFRIRAAVIMPKKTAGKIEELFGQKKIREALEFCRKDPSVLARMVGAGLSEIRGGYADMQQVMGEIGDEESIRQHQTVGMFALIASVAPLFGLLGTVWGMILTMNTIALSPDAMAKPAEMADSIQKALVTTCFGLLAAIPNVFFFNIFRNRVVNLMIECSTVADDLMVRFKGLQPSIPSRTAPAKAAPARPAAPAKAEESARETTASQADEETKIEEPDAGEEAPENAGEEAPAEEPIEVTEEAEVDEEEKEED